LLFLSSFISSLTLFHFFVSFIFSFLSVYCFLSLFPLISLFASLFSFVFRLPVLIYYYYYYYYYFCFTFISFLSRVISFPWFCTFFFYVFSVLLLTFSHIKTLR
jgi:hypothetical protein